MTLSELSTQYRQQAEIIKRQIQDRKRKIKHSASNPFLKGKYEHEISILEEMYREVMIAANALEHYYEDRSGEKSNERANRFIR